MDLCRRTVDACDLFMLRTGRSHGHRLVVMVGRVARGSTLDESSEQLMALRDAGVSRGMCQNLRHGVLEVVALLGDELAPRVA